MYREGRGGEEGEAEPEREKGSRAKEEKKGVERGAQKTGGRG